MQGSDFIWLVSIILGITVVGWLVLDWLESAQHWETYDVDPDSITMSGRGRGDGLSQDPYDAELEMMLSYPLDPFAPALLWRPSPQDQWIEAQETTSVSVEDEQAADLRPSEAA